MRTMFLAAATVAALSGSTSATVHTGSQNHGSRHRSPGCIGTAGEPHRSSGLPDALRRADD